MPTSDPGNGSTPPHFYCLGICFRIASNDPVCAANPCHSGNRPYSNHSVVFQPTPGFCNTSPSAIPAVDYGNAPTPQPSPPTPVLILESLCLSTTHPGRREPAESSNRAPRVPVPPSTPVSIMGTVLSSPTHASNAQTYWVLLIPGHYTPHKIRLTRVPGTSTGATRSIKCLFPLSLGILCLPPFLDFLHLQPTHSRELYPTHPLPITDSRVYPTHASHRTQPAYSCEPHPTYPSSHLAPVSCAPPIPIIPVPAIVPTLGTPPYPPPPGPWDPSPLCMIPVPGFALPWLFTDPLVLLTTPYSYYHS
ncbi:hypothetical protein DXG01_001353 [Tephrocybe rancida]|nr:hypothetical protein DXG01_001353 [Tephrocybe rancida]